MDQDFLIRIVDDDPEIRNSLEFLLQTDGWKVISYPDGQACIENDDTAQQGCYILDIRMPRMNGLSLQKAIFQRNRHAQILFLTAHGDIDLCVQAMKEGALDFLLKPVNEEHLLDVIASVKQQSSTRGNTEEILDRWSRLTPREKEILPLVAQGMLNRDIAKRLGLSFRTVQTHRQLGMKSLGVTSVADLNQFLAEIKNLDFC